MSPQVMSMNTMAWRNTPALLLHPVGVATHSPNTRRVILNTSGLAMMKKMDADISDMTNFSSCFFPLQPQPQSLNKPIYNSTVEKNILKSEGL